MVAQILTDEGNVCGCVETLWRAGDGDVVRIDWWLYENEPKGVYSFTDEEIDK